MNKKFWFKIFTLFVVLALSVAGLAACNQTEEKKIELNITVKEIYVGNSFDLTAMTVPEGAEVIWASSNDNVATVNKGKVTGVSAGEATITAKNDTAEATCSVTVKALAKKYSVKFVNGDAELKNVEVEEGSYAVYSGVIPQKAAGDSVAYEFIGWAETEGGETVDLSIIRITQNKTFYAVFRETAYVNLTLYGGAEISVLPVPVKEYLELEDENDIAAYLYNYEETYKQANSASGVVFKWDVVNNEDVVFYLSTDENFSENVYSKDVSGKTLTVYNLIPDTYYWKIETASGKTSETDSFVISDSVRAINCGNIVNMRDEGGYTGEFGTVEYGKVYRAADIKDANAEAVDVLVNQLKIKTEIDLRIGTETVAPDDSINKVNCGFWHNDYIFPDFNPNRAFSQTYAQALNKAFKLFTEEDNYPIVFHCTSGADRTGTFAFLLGGILGEDYSDLVKDFEITSFYMHRRWRSAINQMENGFVFDASGVMQDDTGNLVAFGKMYNHMMSAYGNGDGKLSSAVENYLISVVGLTKYDIETIRYIMLGSDMKPDETKTYTITWDVEGTRTEQSFIYGSTPIWYGSAPIKHDSDLCSYKFRGWANTYDGEKINTLPKVNEDAIYYALFEVDEIFEAPKFASGKILYSSNNSEIFIPDGLTSENVFVSQVKLKGQTDVIIYDGETWDYSLITLTEDELSENRVFNYKTVVNLSDGTKYRVDLEVYAGVIDELNDFVTFFDKAPEMSYRNTKDYPNGKLAAQNIYGYYIVTKNLGDGTDKLTFNNQTKDTDYVRPNGFNGVLDGQGHTLKFELTKGGLVGLILGNATIKNLAVIYSDTSFVSMDNGGFGVFGYMAVGTPVIDNCYIERTNNDYQRGTVFGLMARPYERLVLRNTVVYGFNVNNDTTWYNADNVHISEESTNAYVVCGRSNAATQIMATNFTKVYTDGTGVANQPRKVLAADIANASGFNADYWDKTDGVIWKGTADSAYSVIQAA